ncbi:hypothetical protein, partial [Tolypothrix sp. VBCCA 56010]|uniref:hypothetical protein n=1 Tax=Tolypothrix sp. VBCCA 56010 TaxID=3137731 RepID=UPI003D7CB876
PHSPLPHSPTPHSPLPTPHSPLPSMLQARWFQILRALGLEFWLLLPLLGLAFWAGSGFVTDKLLNRSLSTDKYLRADIQLAKKAPKTTLSIQAKINKVKGFSTVTVKTANSTLKELKFEFVFTELSQVEMAISQELGLSGEDVKRLVHYEIIEKKM